MGQGRRLPWCLVWLRVRKGRLVAAALFSVAVYLLGVWAFRGVAWHIRWSAVLSEAATGRGVVTFRWPDVMPELGPLWAEVSQCALELRESVPVRNMRMLYTCDPANSSLMVNGWGCTEHGRRHLERILGQLPEGSEESLFSEYASYEEEDRGHGIGLKEHCGLRTSDVSAELAAALAPNLTIQLDDRSPCHSSYRLISTGKGGEGALGGEGQHFGTTHHLGSISLRRADGPPCTNRMINAVEQTLGLSGMQYVWANTSFRGMYWYPPGGFTEWHTDGHHVSGWRLYLTDVDVEEESWFAYRKQGQTHWVPDRHGQANLFRVVPGRPLWHAVASEGAQRISIGVAISDRLAREVLMRIATA